MAQCKIDGCEFQWLGWDELRAHLLECHPEELAPISDVSETDWQFAGIVGEGDEPDDLGCDRVERP